MDLPNKKTAYILFAIAAAEGTWVYFNMAGHVERFWRWTGFFLRRAGLLGWTLALLCAFLYTWTAARLPSVRENLVRPSLLKLLALLVAFAAGFCEEAIFPQIADELAAIFRVSCCYPSNIFGLRLRCSAQRLGFVSTQLAGSDGRHGCDRLPGVWQWCTLPRGEFLRRAS